MIKFNLEEWEHKKFTTKKKALHEIEVLNVIGEEIEEIIILDRDNITNSNNYLRNLYINEVIIEENRQKEVYIPKIVEFEKNYKRVELDIFPKDFKYSCPTYSHMPLILKMKNGKYFEIFYWEHFEAKNSKLTWTRELHLSIDELKDLIPTANPIMNYNKLYSFVLNKKIVDINFDTLKYYNKHGNKLSKDDAINQVNIELENGYVIKLITTAPNTGYLILIYDIKNQTFENFSIYDFKESFLGDIDIINKVEVDRK